MKNIQKKKQVVCNYVPLKLMNDKSLLNLDERNE